MDRLTLLIALTLFLTSLHNVHGCANKTVPTSSVCDKYCGDTLPELYYKVCDDEKRSIKRTYDSFFPLSYLKGGSDLRLRAMLGVPRGLLCT